MEVPSKKETGKEEAKDCVYFSVMSILDNIGHAVSYCILRRLF